MSDVRRENKIRDALPSPISWMQQIVGLKQKLSAGCVGRIERLRNQQAVCGTTTNSFETIWLS